MYSLFRNILSVAKANRLRFLLASAMVLISNGLLVFNPLVFRQSVLAMDPSAPSLEGRLGAFLEYILGPYISILPLWVSFLVAIALLSAYFKYRMRIIFITISRDAESELRSLLFEKMQNQSRVFFDRYKIGELMSRLTQVQ